MQLGLGALVTLIVLGIKSPATSLSTAVSALSLGVYLIHPLVYATALRTGLVDGAFMYLLVMFGSLAGTLILRRALPMAV